MALSVALSAAASAGAEALETEVNDKSPRGAMTLFYERARHRDFDRAAELLRAPGRTIETPGVRARELYEVLLRRTGLELEALSDRAEGRLDDGLAPGVEEIARVGGTNGEGSQPVRLVRLTSGSWVLARESLAKVPEWANGLQNRWLRERLPASLTGPGPLGLALWQWLALPLLALALFVLARLVGVGVGALSRALVRRTKAAVDDARLRAMRGPRDVGLFALGFYAVLPWVDLPTAVEQTLARAGAALGYLALLGLVLRAMDVLADLARESAYVRARPVTEGFLPLGTKLAKVTVFVIALATMLQWLGLPVASIVASLGVGGVAVALAAKTTVENLLGALALSADRAFRPGDLVRIDDLIGTVEHIGLRSTRIRTADRSVVAVPNGRLAELRIESLSARDRMRLAFVLVLPLETRTEALRAVLARVEACVKSQALVIAEDSSVLLRELTPAGIIIEVGTWFRTQDALAFAAGRQTLLLEVLEAVEHAGARLASPPQWVISQAAPKL